ncbi:MAG: PQQ-binding-like beta-propeller repeat protein [Planctomycetota bacterium]
MLHCCVPTSLRHLRSPLLVVAAVLAVPLLSFAGDWPQILGPDRNGVAVGERLHATWSNQGPKRLWETPVGDGFAGVAVAGERVVAFVRDGNSEVVRCHAAATGEVLWQAPAPCSYQGGISTDKGPRCVPVITSQFVITLGVTGRLRCNSLADGSELWQRDTTADFEPLEGYFGVGSTPVIAGDRVIVNVGGRRDASIVAFSLKDGSTLWKTFTDAASYSAPVVTRSGDTSLALVVTRLHLCGIDTADGRIAFTLPFGARGPTVNGASPVILGERIFVSSSYNIGSLLVSFTASAAKELHRDERLLATQYATPVRGTTDGILFAMDGRQDSGSGSAALKCIDVNSWKVLWEEPGFDYGTLLRVGDELLVVTCGGELIRVAADPRGYRESQRARIVAPTDSGYRLPAISSGRLFVRDDSTLKCLEVGPAR